MSRKVVTLARLVDRYIEERINTGQIQGRTPDTYRRALDRMITELGDDTDPFTVTYDDLIDVLADWKLSRTSKANRISVMRNFWQWVSDRHDVPNPAQKLKGRKGPRPALRRLSVEEVGRMLRAPMSERDRLVVWLFAMTGIRRAEIIGIRWRDVDLAQRVIVVRGKGDKERVLPIPHPLATFLGELKAKLSEHGHAEPDHYVCCRRYEYQAGRTGKRRARIDPDKPMGYTNPVKILIRVARIAWVNDPEHVGPHKLRHAYAAAFRAANPGDLFHLQALLGHSDISTTRMYLPDAEQHELQAAVDAAFVTEFVTGPEFDPSSSPEIPANVGEERMKGLEPSRQTDSSDPAAGRIPTDPTSRDSDAHRSAPEGGAA